jgi:hypothetical protein
MTQITVRRPGILDLVKALDHIRPADKMEWLRGTGIPFEHSAAFALRTSEVCLAAFDEDERMLCTWGGDEGVVWLFATSFGEDRAISLHRILDEHLDDLVDTWGRLTALADEDNKVHHRWLRWLGFKDHGKRTGGALSLPFRLFSFER